MKIKNLKSNPFLDSYLQYVKNTEPPRLMHLWSAIATASGAMGRHVWFDLGIKKIYPNMFVLLVGPPATKKTTAIEFATKLLQDNTHVRFAPDDTGGQRQGLIHAFESLYEENGDGDMNGLKDSELVNADVFSTDDIMEQIENIQANELPSRSHAADGNCLFASASEFGSFMGEANSGMIRLLNKVFDAEGYFYKIKHEYKHLQDPLLSILGGTTTSDLSKILPNESVGQGFMSRWILVFAPGREKKVFEPNLDMAAKKFLNGIYAYLHFEKVGGMTYDPKARDYMKHLYEKEEDPIKDSRFMYYANRRYTHLVKLCTILASTRRQDKIYLEDAELANAILTATEIGMPDALGEFGLSPLSAAKQKMLEFLQHTPDVITLNVLWAIMQRDMKPLDFQSAVDDLCNKGKLKKISSNGKTAVVYVDGFADVFDDLVEGVNQ